MKPDSCSTYVTQQEGCNGSTGSYENSRVRVVRLKRHSNIPLGFSVRGGLEHGTGIFVSEVSPGTEAHKQGLLVGDQILRINGFNIEYAIHDEVLALLRGKQGVVIKVKSMGMIPVKDSKQDPLTWKIIEKGHSTSEVIESKLEHFNYPNTSGYTETKVTIPSIGSSGLGCSIVKGPPEFPGIYIQSVKTGSLASQAGLEVGDRIMEMNGRNFNKLDFADAVAVLKSSKQMSLILCKGFGLDLFRDEKDSTESRDSFKNQEAKMLSQVQEDDVRIERRAKKMNEQTSRVKNGFIKKQSMASTEQGNKFSERSSQKDTDAATKEHNCDIKNGKAQAYRNIQVSAAVHASYEKSGTNGLERITRESGDGMDYESINRQEALANGAGSNHLKQDKSVNSQKAISDEAELCPDSNKFQSDKLLAFNSHLQNGTKNKFVPGVKAQRTNSSTSDETSERSSMSSDDYTGLSRTAKSECPRPPNEFLKRKQHELLMEEFREVHKKMFGQELCRMSKPIELTKNEVQDRTRYRQQIRKDKCIPPPPIDMTLTESLPRCLFHRDSDEEIGNERVSYRRRQREPPSTINLCPESCPTPNHPEKSESDSKPLVKIGPYPNNIQQNRFLLSEKDKKALDQKSKAFSSKTDASHNAVEAKNDAGFASSSSSTVPSSSSSEPQSPTTESVTSSDSFFHQSAYQTVIHHPAVISQSQNVPNNTQMSVSQFSKHFEQSLKFGRTRSEQDNRKNGMCPIQKKTEVFGGKGSNDEFVVVAAEEEDLNGKEIKKIILKKNGPLNFRIEGGINSNPEGKIVVSELWNGSCTTTGGSVEIGDQILKVDSTKLTGLSLTAANVALRNANSNGNEEMLLTIARLPK